MEGGDQSDARDHDLTRCIKQKDHMTRPPVRDAASPHGADVSGEYHRRDTCRACDGRELDLVLALGNQPLANALPSSPTDFITERFYPLDLYFCRSCALVQVLDLVDPEVLFRHYLYVTGTSETIAAHNERYAGTVIDRLRLGPADLVAEIASNDGSLLQCFRALGVRVLGIEPAGNIAAMARARGIETVGRFFNRRAGSEIAATHGQARAIIGNNVFAHVDDPVGFLAGCADLLTDDGHVFLECPYALDMVERGEYDTIYHEHLSYFSVTSLARIAEAAGMSVVSVDRVPVHGGSIRAMVGKGGTHGEQPVSMMAMERQEGLASVDRWMAFGRAAAQNKRDLLHLLNALRADGRSIAGYGAPAKGNTLLNFCGIGVDLLPWTVDRNPLKVGRFLPGVHIPVLPVDTVLARRPDYLLVLPWNFADEIIRQQQDFALAGGRFIIPIPTPRVV
jgi:novobiocin biosynthesis protein NovU/D-mycarose 3-C-methyltransferase